LINGLVPGIEILRWATKNEVAVCAFNFSNFETLQAVRLAASEASVPIILQVTESAINYMGLDHVVAMVSVIAKNNDSPVSLHLDHGKSSDICKKCIDSGFSSVMIDKSSASFEENVTYTLEVVEYAKNFGVSVEGELGVLTGYEDGVAVSEPSSMFTDPTQATRYVEATGVDSLAVAIGTVHGPYKGRSSAPKIDITRLKEIKRLVGEHYPLVLHGASSVYPDLMSLCNQYGADIHGACGLPDSELQSAIKFGINKVNIDTDIRMAFIAGLRQSFIMNPSSLDIRKHFSEAMKLVKDIAIRKIELITKVKSV
jgi:fructose-bisphosphate aldolase class II